MSLYQHCFLLFLLLLVGCVSAANVKSPKTIDVQPLNAARYDNYRLYRLHLETEEQVQIFVQLEEVSDSVLFMGHARQPGQRLTIIVSAHKVADVTELLERFNVEHQILSYNFQETIDAQFRSVKPKSTSGRDIDWDHYFHLDTIHDWLDHLVALHPDRVQAIDLGRSFEGRSIKGVKLSSGPGRTGIFVEGGIHAREWISPSTVTFLLNQLLTSADPAVQDIASSFDWYIVPVVNPDGYAFTFDGDRMWRKTRKPNGLCVGADMNRNFDSQWNGPGSSTDPCRYDFAGASVTSEPEAMHVSRFITENRNSSRIETYIALHSYSQLIMFPFGHTAEPLANYDDMTSIVRQGVSAIGRRFGTVYQSGSKHETIYPSSGGSIDWAYAEAGVPVPITFELRGPPDSEFMFNLPADQITPVGWETLDAFVAMLNEARRLGYYTANRRQLREFNGFQ